MPPIILYIAFFEWYVLPVVIVIAGIYFIFYYARLFDITRKQFIVATIGGFVFSILVDEFHYVTSTHMLVSLYNNIFTYTELTILPFIMIYMIYFVFAGKRNLKKKYNIEISGLKLREIRRLKEMHR